LGKDVVIDKLIVFKSKHLLVVYSGEVEQKRYHISIGKEPIGRKQIQGDMKTPEGLYTINSKNSNSRFYRNLGLSYPNSDDIVNAKKRGNKAGGDIKIHGIQPRYSFIGKFHRMIDWTDGCIAVTNSEIEELFNHTIVGATIEIKP
jgi:murein L,D-transpeptidase YafK